jgi:hypothetical protein
MTTDMTKGTEVERLFLEFWGWWRWSFGLLATPHPGENTRLLASGSGRSGFDRFMRLGARMIDVGERLCGKSVFIVAIPAKNCGLLRRGERFGLGAEVGRGRAGEVCGSGCVGGGKIDFRLASPERQLHFARGSCRILIDGVRVKVTVIVFALAVEGFDIKVCDRGARDGGGGLRFRLGFLREEATENWHG